MTIPFSIRKQLNLEEGSAFLVVCNEGKDIKIFPLTKGKVAYFKAIISDNPGTLSKVLKIISENSIDLIASSSATIERGKEAEWVAIADISHCNNVGIDKEAIENDIVKRIEISVI